MQEVDIPPLPTIVLAVMQYDPVKSSSQGLETIIAPDKAICTEILRVANSTYFGRSGRVQSVKDAITLLGGKAIKNLVIFLSTKQLKANLKGPLFKKYLHEYPIVAALLAQDLAKQMGLKTRAEEAFLAGLLRTIGMTVLAMKHGQSYSAMLEEAEKGVTVLADLERSLLGTDHLEVAQTVFEKWNLPTEFSKVLAPANPGDTDPMHGIVTIASHIAKKSVSIPAPHEAELLAGALSAMGKDMSFLAQLEESASSVKEHPFYMQAAG